MCVDVRVRCLDVAQTATNQHHYAASVVFGKWGGVCDVVRNIVGAFIEKKMQQKTGRTAHTVERLCRRSVTLTLTVIAV